MAKPNLGPEHRQAIEQVLGYLNFSSGSHDPQFFTNLNLLYRQLKPADDRPNWRQLVDLLKEQLGSLGDTSAAFKDADQASTVVQLIEEHVLPGYLEFHQDLLFHQRDADLFNAFFFGRVCETVLQQGSPWHETDRVRDGAIRHLNDYIGYRPVAALESQKIEPYSHEWVRPIPLYVENVGAAAGPHEEVVLAALQLLQNTDPVLLRAAYYDPAALAELAIDPRAYDFDHPVNKRPNYHFGQWDPNCIDNKGHYRRFVVQQVTLDALMSRIDERDDLPRDEIVFEAAAVLAGTVLMASGICGRGPDTHDSSVTFANLLPHIAGYRDAFYEHLFDQVSGKHAERLRAEAAERRQPFGGARQHLNAKLARLRATQLERVHLSAVFARMGYSDAASQQANVVPVASARMLCRIDCNLTAGHHAIDRGDLQRADALLPKTVDTLRRAIGCGAVIDPWNILGFDAHFSLFPSPDSSIHDHRADELLVVVDQIVAFCARLWSEAAAIDDQALCTQIDQQFKEITDWWHQYATHEVSSVEGVDGREAYEAARHVAQALNLWHKGGAAAGDIGFWSEHAEMFDSPKAYALVIHALLEKGDLVTSMALLIHWLGQGERIPLEQGECSFYILAERWLLLVQESCADHTNDQAAASNLPRKFLDYVESNAEDYWNVPKFQLGTAEARKPPPEHDELDDDDDADDLYGAAYEDVVYRDSTDDGIEGSIFDTGSSSDDELEREANRIAQRLAFHDSLANMWRFAAFVPDDTPAADRADTIHRWVRIAWDNYRDLDDLVRDLESYQIPAPTGDHDSMVDYDRRRTIRDSLLEQVVATWVEYAKSIRWLTAAVPDDQRADNPPKSIDEDQHQAAQLSRAALRGDVDAVRAGFPEFLQTIRKQPLLYVPLSKGGDSRCFFTARVRQQAIRDLLAWLPRLGLFTETYRLIEAARAMERNHSVGHGAVTEFDELFKAGFRSMVENLVASSESWEASGDDDDAKTPQESLVDCLEQTTEVILYSWLKHSRTLRLSVLERVNEEEDWNDLVEFIETYGADLFTQRFFNLGNVRAILHQGVDDWLASLMEDPTADEEFRLLDELNGGVSGELTHESAAEQLSLVLEAIVENYGEYRDYNSTTTQSDRGELLYTLLDFLRLRTNYDRIAWNLKPVVWAHEVLVRNNQNEAARRWRRSLTERIREQSDKYLEDLEELQKQHAMRMPTVADRIGERFVRPLQIDRVRALVEPAIRDANSDDPCAAFEILQHETESLASQPSGVGLDVPPWLLALEDEVEHVRRGNQELGNDELDTLIPRIPLTIEEVKQQVAEWSKKD